MRIPVEPFKPILSTLPLEFSPRLAAASDEKHVRHYLLPGRVFASAQPAAITTIVGSSVALCLWDPVSGCGGAAHFLLPEVPPDDPKNTKYSFVAGETLLQQMLGLGAHQHALEAKIFGGLEPAVNFGNSANCLGNRNVEAALKFLKAKGIRLAAKEVAGRSGRKVIFQTDDGRSWSESL